MANDPSHQRTVKVRAKDEHGKTVFLTQTANIRQSWRDNVFFVRIGTGKLLELAKGQTGIAFKSKDELVQAIDWVGSQVSAGSYDKQLETAGRPGKRKAQPK